MMKVQTIDFRKIKGSFIIGLFLISIFASALTVGISYESNLSDPTLSFSPATSNVTVGQQFSVDVVIDYAVKLYGFEVWISFNNTKLNATSISYMGYLNEPTQTWYQEVNNTGGYVAWAQSSRNPATGKTGGSPPSLARINFTALETGTSQLDFFYTILSDDLGRPMSHQATDGQVNISASTLYNDVVFDSNFDMGNLMNVTFMEGNSTGYRLYTAELNYSTVTFLDKHWWFYFSMSNATGKTVKVMLTNLAVPDFTGAPSDLPRWPDVEPVYTYDNVNWLRVPDGDFVCGDSNTRDFNITLSPTQNKVWLAPIPPYTVTMRDNLLNSLSSSPYLSVQSLGTTPLGQTLKVATVTDSSYPDESKFKIYVIAQQHAGETVGSFVAEGMIRFLLNGTDAKATALRKDYIFRFVLIVNVEGVYNGISRYTPFRSGAQYDLNRAWANNPISTTTVPEVNWTFTDVQNFMPDAFLDMHSEINGEGSSQTSIDCFYLHDGLYDTVMANFCNNVSTGFDGTKDYWPETAPRSATGSTMASTNIRTRLGIHPAVDMEHPHDDLRNTTAHPVNHNPQTIDDWKDWGRRIDLGIYDYLGEIALPQYTLTINTNGNGSVDKNPDQTNYTYGTNVTLTANAAVGWGFANWTGDASGSVSPVTINMTGNKVVTATFVQNQYTLTVNIVGGGSVVKSPNQTTYVWGTNVSLSASAGVGWGFANWTGDASGSVSPVTINMTGNKVVTATFVQNQYTLTVNIVGSGIVGKNPDLATYTHGTNVTLNATAQPGWVFSSWSDDQTGSVNPVTLTMNGNKVVTATFTEVGAEVHDVVITNVTTSKQGCLPIPTVCRGYTSSIFITVENHGNFTETVSIHAYVNSTAGQLLVGTQNVTLNIGDSVVVSFVWNTTGLATGNYTVHAEVDVVPGESNVENNVLYDGNILVSILGDITGPAGRPDGKVDMYDVGNVARRFMAKSPSPDYNPNFDINDDGIINMFDIAVVARHFMEHE